MAVPVQTRAILVVLLAAVVFTTIVTQFYHGSPASCRLCFEGCCESGAAPLLMPTSAADPCKASISGYLFCDRCYNGLNDTDDYPLAGVKVTASCRPFGDLIPTYYTPFATNTTRTDDNGYYEFRSLINTYESIERDTGSPAEDYWSCSVSAAELPPPCNVHTLSSPLTSLCNSNRLSTGRFNFHPHAGDVITTGRSCFAERPSPKSCRQPSQPQVKECAQRILYPSFITSSSSQRSTLVINSLPAGRDSFSGNITQPVQYSLSNTSPYIGTRLAALTVSRDIIYWAEVIGEDLSNEIYSWQDLTSRFLSASTTSATERIPTRQLQVLSDDFLPSIFYPSGVSQNEPIGFAVDDTADQVFVFVSKKAIIYAKGPLPGDTGRVPPVIYTATEGPHMSPEIRTTDITITSLQIDTSAKPTPMLYWVETQRLSQSSNASSLAPAMAPALKGDSPERWYVTTNIKRGALSHNRTGHLRSVQVLFKLTRQHNQGDGYNGMLVGQLQLDPVNRRLYALHQYYHVHYQNYQEDVKNLSSYLSVYDIGAAISDQTYSRTSMRSLRICVQSFRIDVLSNPPIMYALDGYGVMYKLQLRHLDRNSGSETVAVLPYLMVPHDYNRGIDFDILYDPACK